MKVQISAVIITYNEERNIGRCLESLRDVADEIVVVDSFSSDRTEEICRSYDAVFVKQRFQGWVEQKNWAILQASSPYILSLDADEALSAEIKKSILGVKENWTHDGYYFNRLTSYCGKWIRHTSWYPSRKLRLWDSRKGSFGGINPHDKFIMNQGARTKHLKGDLLHYSYYSIEEHCLQINSFSSTMARSYFSRGKRISFLGIIVHSAWRFLKDFIILRGFLDGFFGYIISTNSAYEVFLKYVKLRNLYREEKRSSSGTLCFFNSVKTWGGGEKWHYEMAKRLHEKGLPVIIYTNRASELKTRADLSKIPNYQLRINNLSFLNPFKIIKLAINFRKLKIKTIVLNLSADVKTAGLAARFACIPQIIYRRGSAIHIRNSIMNRFLFRHVVHQVIANSIETKRTILSRNPGLISEHQINIIYNGIDLAVFDREKVDFSYTRENNEIIIGNVGRLVKQKGQKYLIDLAIRLKKKTSNFKILIAGEGKMETELASRVAINKLEDRFKFVGFVNDIKGFMKSIDIFVLTSLWEGFGYVLIEAMACKVPVVAFDISSNPEIVEHNHTGYLVPLFDMDAMTEKVAQLMDDEQLRLHMGREGRKRVEKHFSFESTQQNFEKLLSEYWPLPYK
jgi:glycosyltransferase involved in cell wall biosynthesis